MSIKHSSILPDELLSAYIDQQITEAERRRVETSLAVDPALQKRLNDLKRTVRLLRNTPVVAAPRAFTLSEAQLLASENSTRKPGTPAFWLRWMPRLAPALIMVVAVLFVFSLMGDLRNSPIPAAPAEQQAITLASQTAPAKSLARQEERSTSPQKLSDSGPVATKAPAAPLPLMAEKPLASARIESNTAEDESKNQTKDSTNPGKIETEKSAALEPESAPAATPEHPAPSGRATLFSLQTIGLGILLIVLVFFVWRIIFSRRQRH